MSGLRYLCVALVVCACGTRGSLAGDGTGSATDGTGTDTCDAEPCEDEIETVEIDWGQHHDSTARVGGWGIEEGLLTYVAGVPLQIAQATCTVVSVTDEGGHFPIRMTTTCVEAEEPEEDQYDFHETTIWRLPGDVAWGELREGQAFTIESYIELLGDLGSRGFTRAWDEDGNLLQISIGSSSNPPGMPPELHPPGTDETWLEPFSFEVDRCVCAPRDLCSELAPRIVTPFGLHVETDRGEWLVRSSTKEEGILSGDNESYRMVLFGAAYSVGGDAACAEGNLEGGEEFYTFVIYRLPGDGDTGTETATETGANTDAGTDTTDGSTGTGSTTGSTATASAPTGTTTGSGS